MRYLSPALKTFFILFLMVAALEIRLRTAINIPGIRNDSTHASPDTVRLLALGDSITKGIERQGSYPAELERILNGAGLCKKFQVVNAGLPGAETFDVLSQIDALLDRYQPSIVITMIGGDDRNTFTDDSWTFKLRVALRKLRVVKLASLLLRNQRLQKTEMPEAEDGLSKDYPSIFATFYDSGLDSSEYTHKFGAHLRREKKYSEAMGYHLEMLKRYPGHNAAKIELGYVYQELGKFSKAEQTFQSAVEFAQNSPEKSDDHTWGYFALGELYENQLHSPAKAEKIFLEAVRRLPDWHFSYIFLSNLYRKNHQPKKQEEILLSGIKNSADSWRIYANLETLYRERGDTVEARKYEALALKLKEISLTSPFTLTHYTRLSAAIRKRGSLHIVMPYPRHSPEILRATLGEGPNLVYIDNRKRFTGALENGKYEDYFLDEFGGNFGHLNHRSAALVAENIAEALLPRLKADCARIENTETPPATGPSPH